MFSDCSGPCETCRTHYTGGCLAGHGDDDYVYASPEWIKTYRKGLRQRAVKEAEQAEYEARAAVRAGAAEAAAAEARAKADAADARSRAAGWWAQWREKRAARTRT